MHRPLAWLTRHPFVMALVALALFTTPAQAEEPLGDIPLDTPLVHGAPNVVGMSQDDALKTLDDAGIESNIVTVVSNKVGIVIEQEPAAGKDIHTGDEMGILIGIKALVQTQMPNLVGRDEGVLEQLREMYFIDVSYVQGPPNKVGLVVAQQPQGGKNHPARGRLKVQVVRGNSIVPSVLGKSEADARKILAGARLVADIKHVDDASAPDGTVMSQEPSSGSEALPMSTVQLRVAGHAHDHEHDHGDEQPEPAPGPDVEDTQVPNLVGMSIEQAQTALFDLGLVPSPEFVDAPGAPAWSVLRQDTLPGTRVEQDTIVRFSVAKEVAPPTPAPTPTLAQVPNVIGFKSDQARAALQANGLKTRRIYRIRGDVDPRRVMEQYPAAGSVVPLGTRVTYVLPRTAVMPQILGLSKNDAIARLTGAGFNYSSQQIGWGGGDTKVTWQQFPAGSLLASNSTVDFKFTVVAIPQPLVHVPHVTGQTRSQASALLQSKGFQVETLNVGGVGPLTEVISQHPVGGSLRQHGTTVKIRYKRKGLGGLLKPVPNVVGKSRNQAINILQAAGFQAQGLQTGGIGPGTVVIDQAPNAGQLRPAGALVKFRFKRKLLQSLRPVPNVLGKTRQQARNILQAAGFQVQTHKIGGAGPNTKVVDTDPNAGTLRPTGSTVLVKYKRTGLINVLKPVPNVLGKTRTQAQAILQGAGFQVQLVPVGGIGTKTKVVDTNPNPGQLRPAGSTIQVRYKRVLVISILKVKVPNLINKSKAQAKAILQARGLKWKFVGPFLAPRVKTQNRPAGLKVLKGTKITMQMGF